MCLKPYLYPRDLELLGTIYRFRVMTAHQLVRLFYRDGKGGRYGYTRLVELMDRGYLGSFRWFRRGPRGRYPYVVYYLTSRGVAAVEGDRPAHRNRPHPGRIRHCLDAGEVYVRLREKGRLQPPVEFLESREARKRLGLKHGAHLGAVVGKEGAWHAVHIAPDSLAGQAGTYFARVARGALGGMESHLVLAHSRRQVKVLVSMALKRGVASPFRVLLFNDGVEVLAEILRGGPNAYDMQFARWLAEQYEGMRLKRAPAGASLPIVGSLNGSSFYVGEAVSGEVRRLAVLTGYPLEYRARIFGEPGAVCLSVRDGQHAQELGKLLAGYGRNLVLIVNATNECYVPSAEGLNPCGLEVITGDQQRS